MKHEVRDEHGRLVCKFDPNTDSIEFKRKNEHEPLRVTIQQIRNSTNLPYTMHMK